jgi:subtilisin family serine protease
MPFDEGNKGDPFRGDFPDRPDREPWGELEAEVQRQVIELAQRRYEPAIRHELLRLIQQRRELPAPEPAQRTPEPEPGKSRAAGPGPGAQRPQDAAAARRERSVGGTPGGEITQFDVLPVAVGFDTLLVRGELLITAESYDGLSDTAARRGPFRNAREYIGALGMRATEVGCAELHGRILRLTHSEMSPLELSNLARVLRTRGFTASLSNITPTAPVGKAIGGPLPAPSPGSFQPGSRPGTPARVAIIDTGIAAERRTDRRLRDIPRADNDINPLDQFPLPHGDTFLDFDAGHGTFVAGIVQHIAPDAEITVYRAIDGDGIASEVEVACQLIRAARERAQIINLSLGCQTQDSVPPIAIRAALDVIRDLERDEEREVLIVAAAGNCADTTACWPAAFRRVVSVAALAPDMLPAPWSTHGFWVTCSTIGQGISSTYVKGNESALIDPDPREFGKDAWAVWSGTSFAAPQIVGALARLHDHHEPLRETLRRLLAAGRPIAGFGQALKILPGI